MNLSMRTLIPNRLTMDKSRKILLPLSIDLDLEIIKKSFNKTYDFFHFIDKTYFTFIAENFKYL